MKFRDIVLETVSENNRRSDNFVRIYPSRNCKMYEKYFQGIRHINKIVYKILYSSEFLNYEFSKLKKDKLASTLNQNLKYNI